MNALPVEWFLWMSIPFVYFGLHWLKDDNWLNWFKQWVAVDVIWAIGAGLIMGFLVAKAIVWLDFAGALFFVIRPVGAWISTAGENYKPIRRWLFGWFGIRGVGSLYYLAYALGEGLRDNLGEQIAWITFMTVVLSVVIHGISATPLMTWYEQQLERKV